jgi:hypothetical protein
MDIYWNCWELNSQLIKNFFMVPTIGFSSFEGEIGRILGGAGPQQHALEQQK